MAPELVETFYEAGVFVEDNSGGNATRLRSFNERYGDRFLAGAAVLDIGGGSNPFVGLLPDADRWVSDIVITDAAKEASDHVVEGDFPSAEIESNKFDLITAFHTLEHFPDPARAVKKMSECLKDDGLVLVEVPNFEIYTRNLPHYALFLQHQSYFHRQSLLKLMARFGLELDHMIREDMVILATFRKTGNIACDSSGASSYALSIVEARKAAMNYVDQILHEKLKGYNNPMIYGAGGSTSTFLAVVPWLRGRLVAAFDRDIEKQGKYLPTTRLRVQDPAGIDKAIGDVLIFLSSEVCVAMQRHISINYIDAGAIFSEARSRAFIESDERPVI
ncbi:class I SAM-dependent methyltransferase [Thalassospira sp.]|uniref:class I SAM-dependent methyltransferase n=1 Tax=Thalassospira sp. TaxID=1912094 RepID=UPI002619CFAD|nr:class I SAM-dependent methyltransferase [Thalassospira sp.]